MVTQCTIFFFFFYSLKLLEKKKRIQLKDMGEDLECLCQIMRTVGPRLDHEKAKVNGWGLLVPPYNLIII